MSILEKIAPKKHGGKKVNRHENLTTSGNTYTFEFGMVGVPQNKKRNCKQN
jgi:hypothetical protein